MKKTILILLASLLLLINFVPPVYGLSEAQSVAIEKLLDDACAMSGVPGMSISIISQDKVFYFSSGYANREEGLAANENTIYELASVSKAFTGLGLLLLEDQGLLSMDDPLYKYLEWFTVNYKGQALDRETLTLNHFLHHTSGLTNTSHIQSIPEGSGPDMLEKTVKGLMATDLDFAPGDQYQYGTVNYDVLGLVVEMVSGETYEDFMIDQVFHPLGLYDTYLYKEDARASEQMAQGYKSSFFLTRPYDAPDYGGNKPAGYIMSSSKDMARWMEIQMGMVEDIPEVFKVLVEKSHKGNRYTPDDKGFLYGAGWSVSPDRTIIEHSGGNPNFSSQVTIFPSEGVGICLLTNGANTNIGMVEKIKDILDGNLNQSYRISSMQVWDSFLSLATLVVSLLAIIIFLLAFARRKVNKEEGVSKKKKFTCHVWSAISLLLAIICWAFPSFLGYSWQTLLVWQPYSLLTSLVSLVLLAGSITYLKYTG